jgi:uncharacterized protein
VHAVKEIVSLSPQADRGFNKIDSTTYLVARDLLSSRRRSERHHLRSHEMANQNQNQGQGSNRGFASMDDDKQREIASKGGKAAHESGNAHEFSSEEAAEAGSKGGKAAHASGNAHEFDSREAAEAGRKGGQASGGGNRG